MAAKNAFGSCCHLLSGLLQDEDRERLWPTDCRKSRYGFELIGYAKDEVIGASLHRSPGSGDSRKQGSSHAGWTRWRRHGRPPVTLDEAVAVEPRTPGAASRGEGTQAQTSPDTDKKRLEEAMKKLIDSYKPQMQAAPPANK